MLALIEQAGWNLRFIPVFPSANTGQTTGNMMNRVTDHYVNHVSRKEFQKNLALRFSKSE